ncbi:MAG: 50S ribosome-binding GTPase [Chlamydiae bacterium]|nr:50S ribosome-binding GTPase [Chlamydiota bacterium]
MIERINIGIFGKINAGKSTLMNVITMQNTSLVDEKKGTTSDVNMSIMEIHEMGPVKLFDTPGLDEEELLGEKKKPFC